MVKMTLWMGRNANGEFLTHGNPNPHLSFSLAYPFDAAYMASERWVMCRTKSEMEEIIRQWREESRLVQERHPKNVRFERRIWHCKAVKVEVTWRDARRSV